MKELSIEEKARRYDEILARAKGVNITYYKDDIMSKVKEFVDYLLPEFKESEDLEKAASDCYYHNHAHAIEYFIKGANWQKKQSIEKACRWLKESITNNHECNRIVSKKGVITMGELIKDFKNYMKGE